MSMHTTGTLLARGSTADYRPLGAFGKPAFESYTQLRSMLLVKRGARIANYFSRPTREPQGQELRWTAEIPGAARAWHEITPQEQAHRALELETMRSSLLSYVQELRAQPLGQAGGAAAFASLLEQAMKVPAGGNFLHFVGDQPVISFWGFSDASGASVDPLDVPVQPPNGPVASQPLATPGAVPDSIFSVGLPSGVAADKPMTPRRHSWWQRWWWVLPILLALGLLVSLLRGCGTSGDVIASMAGSPSVPAPPLAASRPGLEGNQVQGNLPQVSGGMTDPPALAAATAQPPAIPASSAQPDNNETGTTAGSQPSVPQASGQPDIPSAGTPASAPSQAQPDSGALKLPGSTGTAGGMGFLEGRWKAGDGLFDRKTGQPLDLSLRFGKDGDGEISLQLPNGTQCQGPVQARLQTGRLDIEGSQTIACGSSGSHGAPRIECHRERSGQTQCYGINADGSRYYMDMRRQQ